MHFPFNEQLISEICFLFDRGLEYMESLSILPKVAKRAKNILSDLTLILYENCMVD